MTPLPNVMTEISTWYAEQENWAYALVTACQIATAGDPFRYSAPFHPMRVNGMLLIARLLSNTAFDTAVMSQSVDKVVAKANLDKDIQDTLSSIDQVSLCQMLLIMVLRLAPDGHAAEWTPSISAKVMLDDIARLPGRERELSLINAWAENPDGDESQAFFKYAVVDPVHGLASFGKAALDISSKEFQR